MKKIAGVSLWVWGVGCLVLAGGVAAVKVGTGNPPEAVAAKETLEAPSHPVVVSKNVIGTDEKLHDMAEKAIVAAQSMMGKSFAKMMAARELKVQGTAGAAQLASRTLQTAEGDESKARMDFFESLNDLATEEAAAGCDDWRSAAVRGFWRSSLDIVSDISVSIGHDGMASAKCQSLLKRYDEMEKANMDSVLRGDYKPTDAAK